METWASPDAGHATVASAGPDSDHSDRTAASDRMVRPHEVLTTAAGFERFELGSELGRGGLGVVRAARDRALWRETAIKLIRDTHNDRTVARFVEEAQITGQLEHPNIVPVHELGLDPVGRPYIAMKLVRGHTWLELIERADRAGHRSTMADLIRDRRLEVFLKICDAIAYAHSRGVVHRDLKPANIMVGEFGEVLVMDWGVARPLGGSARAGRKSLPKRRREAPHARTIRGDDPQTPDGEAGITMTLDGEVLGTPAYMPPEQAAGEGETVDERADIFCLGAMLYHATTYRPPYRGATVWETVDMARRSDRFLPREAAPRLAIPVEIEAIIEKAMATDPRDRYRHVADLRADIENAMANLAVSARRDGPLRRVMKWTRRHPTALAIGAVVSVCLVLLGLAGSVMWAVQLDADRREAELQRAVAEREAERERLQREVAQREAEREKAEIVALAKDGLIDELRQRLGIRLSRQRFEVLEEFHTRMDAAVASGAITEIGFIRDLPRDDVDRYVAAFNRLINLAEESADASLIRAEDYYYLSVLWLWGRDDPTRARGFADRALAIDPDYWQGYVMRGLAFGAERRHRDALAEYERALRVAPDEPVVLANRASAKKDMGDIDGAIADYTRALTVDPRDATNWFNRGDLYRRSGEHQRALADYNEAIRLFPTYGTAYMHRGTVRQQLGNLDQALEDADRAVQLMPRESKAWNNRGTIWLGYGEFAKAIADFDRALELDADNGAACVNRAFARAELGDFAAAIPDYERGLENLDEEDDPAARESRWLAWYNLGVARANTGDVPGAIDAFRMAKTHCTDPAQLADIDAVIRQIGGDPDDD